MAASSLFLGITCFVWRIRNLKLWTTLALACSAVFCCADTQLIVRLQPNADASLLARKYGISLQGQTANAPFALYGISASLDAGKIEAAIQADSAVVWAEEDEGVGTSDCQSAIKGSGIPAIGGRSLLYKINGGLLSQINWSSKLAASPGRTVRIAIIDTGLSVNQKALWEKVDASANFVENGVANDGPNNTDTNGNGIIDEGAGHGTMIAGIIDEIAPQTRFVIARSADSDGMATLWTVIEGLAFAASSGAEVANLSLGTPNSLSALPDVIDWCESQNMMVVSGIGNNGTRDALFPARYSKVICVAGLNPDSTKAYFSNFDSKTNSACPATGIVSEWWDGHLGVWSGTSFSSPMVAAAIADCLRRRSPIATSRIRNLIKDSGRNIDGLNRPFQGQLGTLLDIQRLDSMISSAH